MQNHTALSRHLETQLPTALQFLQDLVSVNSYTLNPAGVKANAQRIIQQFAPLGFTASHQQCAYPGSGSHLILDSGGDAPAIALIAHLDTVFSPEEEERHDFRWNQQDNRIYGPGTMDIKGGTALMWMTLDALRATNPAFFEQTRWILLWNVAEEVLTTDFHDLCLRILPSNTRACLVYEPDDEREENFCLVHARKGRGDFSIHVAGRSAHAGSSHRRGANAIHQLSRLVDRAMALTDLEHGETTVNVGTISGGTVRNTVPNTAQAELETRSYDQQQYQRVRGALLAMNGPGDVAAVSDGHRCKVTVTQTLELLPWPENADTRKLANLWQDVASECGFQLTSRARGGLSDGNPLWNHFPTLDGLGPRGGNAHCARHDPASGAEQEFVDLASFVPKALINCLAIQRL